MCVSREQASVPDPLAALREAVYAELERVVAALGGGAEGVRRFPLRFRPDGRGGELATPLPMGLRLDGQALADGLNAASLPVSAAPSGGWLAIAMTAEWDKLIRAYVPEKPALNSSVPPMPAFDACIDPQFWRLDALAGVCDPFVAARIDRGNPAFRVYWAQLQPPASGESRRLVNEVALLYACLAEGNGQRTAKQMVALADAYLAAPAEGTLVQRALKIGTAALEI